MSKQIKIYSDHIQKRVEQLENEIDSNCLRIYNEWKSTLEEAYLEGVVEYETALMNYNTEVDCAKLKEIITNFFRIKLTNFTCLILLDNSYNVKPIKFRKNNRRL